MEKLVSVVVPVYNVEKYLDECLDSIVNQTYKNLQIILVDDGSTDNSGKICDEYASKDNRITVVHQSNQGAGAAKNTGLDLVSGEYFSIIDADDYIALDYYEIMLNKMIEHNADIVQCLFSNTYVNCKVKKNYSFSFENEKIMSAERFLFELLYDWKYAIFWNKLFRTSLLKNNRFPVGRKIDDEFFTYKLVCNSKKIVNINDRLCNYRMRKSSVMNSNSTDKFVLDRIACFEQRLDHIKNFSKLTYYYYCHFTEFLLKAYISTDSENLKKQLERYIIEYPIKNEGIVRKVLKKYKLRKFRYDNDNEGEDCIHFE